MNRQDAELTGVPSLQEETENQQRAAIFRMTPAMVVILAGFAATGFGKYWDTIPPVWGTVWAIVFAALLFAAFYPRHQWHRSGQIRTSRQRLRVLALAWAFSLGVMLSIGFWFGMMNDDLGGRVTFAVMITGLGGVVLSVTYMVPGMAIAFFLPMFAVLIVGSTQIDPHVSDFQKLATLAVFIGLFLLLIRFNWRLFHEGVKAAVAREEHRMEVIERRAEMDAARRIQMGLLPSAGQALREEARYDLAALLEPAREMTGDLYDFFPIDEDRLFFMVGDVCGKGVGSSLLMAVTKTVIKNAVLRRDVRIGDIMTEVNQELARENHDDQFVTCFAGVMDLNTGLIQYSNAGHEPMIVMGATGVSRTSETVGGPPLCAFEGMEYETGTLQLASGDGVLIFSDGVTEATTASSAAMGVDGLRNLLEGLPNDARPSAIIEAVGRALSGVRQDTLDDTTLMAIRFHGA